MSPAHVLEPTFQRLKRMLMEGAWVPGEKLEALQLADEFGVSMTPVRDCLNRLVGERMVDMKPGEGYRVPQIREKTFRDLLDLSALLVDFGIDSYVEANEPSAIEGTALDYADRVASLFYEIVSGTQNTVMMDVMQLLNNRLHVIRRRDPQFFPDTLVEIGELEQLVASRQPTLPTVVRAYFQRRRNNDDYLVHAIR